MTSVRQTVQPSPIWRWLLLGQLRTFPFRYIFAVLSIAIGIALGFSVHLINASASDAFGDAVRNMSGSSDAQVAGATSLGFDEQLYGQVYNLSEVADVSPVIEMSAVLGESGARVKLLGIDPFRASAITPVLLGRQESSNDQSASRRGDQAALATNIAYLSDAAFASSNAKPGDLLTIRANGQTHDFQIAGDLPGIEAGQSVAVIDIAAAQWHFDRLGVLDRLDIKRSEKATQSSLTRALQEMLPRDARLSGAENEIQKRTSLSRAYRVNLEMLALVALVTGGFLVYSAQSLSAQTRQQQFALLRILGLRKGSLQRQLLWEGLALGLAGSILGLILGYAFAYLILTIIGSDLGGGYFSGSTGPIDVTISALLVFLGFGIFTAVFGSFAPGRRAAALNPVQAIKTAVDHQEKGKQPIWLPGVALLVVAGGLALLPAVDGLPIFGYLAVAAVLAGAIWLTPWLARGLLTPLSRLSGRGIAFDLAVHHLLRSPSQAAAALGGIVASVGLMIAMVIMVSSFRTSVDNWLESILSADLYVSGGLVETSFDSKQQAEIAGLPDIADAEFSKTINISLDPKQPPVNLTVRPVESSQYDLPLIAVAEQRTAGIPVWISEPAARIYDLQIDQNISLPIGARGTPVYVAGIWSDYARQQGAIVMESEDYTALTGISARSEIAISLQDPQDISAASERLKVQIRDIAGTEPQMSNAAGIRDIALGLFDRSFAITYGLEAVAIFIGMVGVGATFAAQVGTRVKEFGMLRHIGFGRREIIKMLAYEGLLLGIVGLAAGLLSGFAISQILVHVINPQSFNLTMKTAIPYMLLLGISATLLITSGLTAIFAGRRAAAADALRAVNEDW